LPEGWVCGIWQRVTIGGSVLLLRAAQMVVLRPESDVVALRGRLRRVLAGLLLLRGIRCIRGLAIWPQENGSHNPNQQQGGLLFRIHGSKPI
jgi:hypothetical protein